MSERVETVVAVVGIGSNIPDRFANLKCGLDRWKAVDGTRVIGWSRVYESAPVGEGFEGDFLNAVIVAETSLTPEELLDACHEIERQCGRDREAEKESASRNRTLDCDVIFFGDDTVTGGEGGNRLVIPHPWWWDRVFVLLPLMDVIEHLTPHQKRLVQSVTNLAKIDLESCRRVENVLD